MTLPHIQSNVGLRSHVTRTEYRAKHEREENLKMETRESFLEKNEEYLRRQEKIIQRELIHFRMRHKSQTEILMDKRDVIYYELCRYREEKAMRSEKITRKAKALELALGRIKDEMQFEGAKWKESKNLILKRLEEITQFLKEFDINSSTLQRHFLEQTLKRAQSQDIQSHHQVEEYLLRIQKYESTLCEIVVKQHLCEAMIQDEQIIIEQCAERVKNARDVYNRSQMGVRQSQRALEETSKKTEEGSTHTYQLLISESNRALGEITKAREYQLVLKKKELDLSRRIKQERKKLEVCQQTRTLAQKTIRRMQLEIKNLKEALMADREKIDLHEKLRALELAYQIKMHSLIQRQNSYIEKRKNLELLLKKIDEEVEKIPDWGSITRLEQMHTHFAKEIHRLNAHYTQRSGYLNQTLREVRAEIRDLGHRVVV